MFILHERKLKCREWQMAQYQAPFLFISIFINLKHINYSNEKSHIGRVRKDVIQLYIMPR